MESFDELGVSPELVEALAAEGIEHPTAFQETAIPVLMRGNNLLAQAGPGAGTLISYGIPLLERIDPEALSPQALVMAPSSESALRLALSISRLAQVTGHRVAALGSPWALPETASILFAAPEDLIREVRGSRISLDQIDIMVVDGFVSIPAAGREALETIFEFLPKDGQRILFSQPLTEAAEALGTAHFQRAVHLPPRAAQPGEGDHPPRRGDVQYRVTGEAKDQAILQTVAHALEEGAQHVVLFFRTEDQAADAGDFLALHGFMAGMPGEPDFPVWLSTTELRSRKLLDEWEGPDVITTVSVDVPTDSDSLDRRHGGEREGVILVRPRELAHLKAVARQTGYRLVPAKEPPPVRIAGELKRLTDLLGRTLQGEDLAPHFLALEPLFDTYSPAEVAAAALHLLQKQAGSPTQSAAEPKAGGADRSQGPPPRTWVRLFLGVGEMDGIGPGDLLGAIAGEAGVEGSQVGKIEIRETFSLVEVNAGVAERVIRGLNGTTIKGRAVRVDHDRGGPKGSRGGPGSRGGRGGDRPRSGGSDRPRSGGRDR